MPADPLPPFVPAASAPDAGKKGLRHWFKRFRSGLLGRFVAVLAAVGLIPLVIVPWLVQKTHDSVIDQILRTHSVAARTTAARVDSWIGGLRTAAETIAENPLLTKLGRDGAGEMIAGLPQVQRAIIAAQVVNARGEEVTSVRGPRALPEIDEGFSTISASVLSATRHRTTIFWLRDVPYLGLGIPLPDDLGELRLIAVLGDEAPELLKTEELGRDAVVALFDGEKRLVAESRVAGEATKFPSELLSDGALRLTSGSKRYETTRPVLVGAHSPIAGAPLFVATVQAASVAEKTTDDMRRTARYAVLAALLLTALFSGLGYVSVIRPITDITNAQWKAAKKARRDPSVGNEIDGLKAAFATLRRQTMDREAIGKIFLSRYLVLDLLGTGGMGSVFRGWDPKLERAVALKTIHMGGSQATVSLQEQRSILMREAVTVAKFSHPNIVAIYDLEDAGDAAFLAMEFIEGISLERLLAFTPVLRVEQAVPLCAQVARGLEAAHAAGVIHCDIKPANVLLGRDGSIKVTDFGIARSLKRTSTEASGTFGTPGYLPPEALRTNEFTAVADLYSLASVLYELLTGSPPHVGKNAQETLVKTASAAVVPVRQKNPAVPPGLDALILGLLEKDPARRKPGTAKEVAVALEELCERNAWKWIPPTAVFGKEGPPRMPDESGEATRQQFG